MAVDSYFRCIVAGGGWTDRMGRQVQTADRRRNKHLRYLLALDQRVNAEPQRTKTYYAHFTRSQIWSYRWSRPPQRPRQIRTNRQVGLYVGSVDSLTARFFAPGIVEGLAHHDFQCVIYTSSKNGDIETAILRDRTRDLDVEFRSFSGKRVREAVSMVIDDSNAIYVDLRGYSTESLLSILSSQPASRTGYMIGSGETSGLSSVDFLVVDPVLWPDDIGYRAERRVLYLSGGLLHYTPANLPAVRSSTLGRSGIRFGAFHQFSKVNRLSIQLWADALCQTPDSTLVLKFNTAAPTGAQRGILRLFAQQGIDASRITFAARKETIEEHFEALSDIDVLLDATPFNGETTTLEALWLGVPVVSVVGQRMIARYGASILHHTGLGQLCAPTYEAFGATAAKTARDVEWRMAFRMNCRRILMETPTYNAELYGRSVAAAFGRALET